jgi:hypothetical protein
MNEQKRPSVKALRNAPREPIADILERARLHLVTTEPPLAPVIELHPASTTNEKRSATPTAPWTDGELETLIQFRLTAAINEGHPPRNAAAFLADQKKRELANEEARPGWIRRCAAGILAAKEGRKITGWRWMRGTHSGTYVRDPYGTDEPPKGY